MVLRRFILFFACLALFACTKQKGIPQAQEAGSDQILFIDYTPDPQLNSVSGSAFIPGLQVLVPAPFDTSCTLLLKDPAGNNNWLRLTAQNYYKLVSPSTPAANYFQEMLLEMLLPGDSVPCFKNKPGCAAFMNAGQIVGPGQSNLVWNKGLYLRKSLLLSCENPSGEKYIPFSRSLPGKAPGYGWILAEFTGVNGVKIKAAAINLSPGRPLRCGQVQ